MKDHLKKLLCRMHLYSRLDALRQLPVVIRWLRNGCPSPAPQAVKMNIVGSYLRRYRLRCFIETGTYRGDTLMHIAAEGVDCLSVELSADLYQSARRLFAGVGNVRLFHGDSGTVLPTLLADLERPALFWLDGHYSGGGTAAGETLSPICTEIEAVLAHPVSQHVVLIDDARCFDGTGGYPHLDNLLARVRREGRYRAEVSADIIRLLPVQA